MSLLPGQILRQEIPFGTVDEEGRVIIEKNWWLFLYNMALNSIGVAAAGGLPASALQDLEGADVDAIDADAISLRQPLSNALQAAMIDPPVVSSSDLPDIARALLLAQDPLLPDAVAIAQPVASITPGGSPFTYTAPGFGVVVVTGGSVSAISVKRQGTSVSTGITTGLIPVARYDQVVVTYSPTAPTMTFIPGSSQ